jgi:hypothetical protein
MTGLDTLMDTLSEGRHSFLDFSTFPDLLKSSNPSLSANKPVGIPAGFSFYRNFEDSNIKEDKQIVSLIQL